MNLLILAMQLFMTDSYQLDTQTSYKAAYSLLKAECIIEAEIKSPQWSCDQFCQLVDNDNEDHADYCIQP